MKKTISLSHWYNKLWCHSNDFAYVANGNCQGLHKRKASTWVMTKWAITWEIRFLLFFLEIINFKWSSSNNLAINFQYIGTFDLWEMNLITMEFMLYNMSRGLFHCNQHFCKSRNKSYITIQLEYQYEGLQNNYNYLSLYIYIEYFKNIIYQQN